jgi:hypothetical protein
MPCTFYKPKCNSPAPPHPTPPPLSPQQVQRNCGCIIGNELKRKTQVQRGPHRAFQCHSLVNLPFKGVDYPEPIVKDHNVQSKVHTHTHTQKWDLIETNIWNKTAFRLALVLSSLTHPQLNMDRMQKAYDAAKARYTMPTYVCAWLFSDQDRSQRR